METEFLIFLKKYGDAGARQKFEDICTRIAQAIYPDAHTVRANPGDYGIDVFVGDLTDKIDVYQCKFFINEFDDAQKSQVRESFKTAIETDEYELKSWTLCVPINFDLQQHKWWAKWSKRQRNQHKIKIRLVNASRLIGLARDQNLFNELFEREEIILLERILELLDRQEVGMKEVLKKPSNIDYTNSLFTQKLHHAGIEENHNLIQDEFYNAELLTKEIESRGIDSEMEEHNSLTQNIHRLWATQYFGYDDKENGGKLLSETYKSLEEHYDRSLKTKVINVSEVEKRGILHQLSNKCELGWIKDYKSKL